MHAPDASGRRRERTSKYMRIAMGAWPDMRAVWPRRSSSGTLSGWDSWRRLMSFTGRWFFWLHHLHRSFGSAHGACSPDACMRRPKSEHGDQNIASQAVVAGLQPQSADTKCGSLHCGGLQEEVWGRRHRSMDARPAPPGLDTPSWTPVTSGVALRCVHMHASSCT